MDWELKYAICHIWDPKKAENFFGFRPPSLWRPVGGILGQCTGAANGVAGLGPWTVGRARPTVPGARFEVSATEVVSAPGKRAAALPKTVPQ